MCSSLASDRRATNNVRVMVGRHATLVIRPRHPDDSRSLKQLAEGGFATYAQQPWRTLRRLILSPRARTFVADAGGDRHGRDVLGCAVVSVEPAPAFGPWTHPALAHLDAIAVQPGSRRRGLGRALLTHAEEHARARGAVSLSLITAANNRPARRLFRDAGYIEFIAVPGFYRGEQDALRMFKPLR
jgi:ribosomal protein S18 acetylase RimI-like enzyme